MAALLVTLPSWHAGRGQHRGDRGGPGRCRGDRSLSPPITPRARFDAPHQSERDYRRCLAVNRKPRSHAAPDNRPGQANPGVVRPIGGWRFMSSPASCRNGTSHERHLQSETRRRQRWSARRPFAQCLSSYGTEHRTLPEGSPTKARGCHSRSCRLRTRGSLPN